MYENAFPYQFLLDLNKISRGQPLSNALKEMLKQLDLSDCRKLEEVLALELQNAPLASQQNLKLLLFYSQTRAFI